MPTTITKSFEVFSVSELSDEAKDRLCNRYRANYDFEWDQQMVIENFIDQHPHIEDMDISYSGFFSQGDGASFTGTIDSDWLIQQFVSEEHKELVKHISCVITRRRGGYYVHENTCETEVTIEEVAEHLENNLSLYESVLEGVEEALTQIIECYRLSVCHKLYTELETQYAHETSDNQIVEIYLDGETLFLEDGTVFEQ